jgi:hypothetical protein
MIKQFRVVTFWWQRWDDKENIAPSQYEDRWNSHNDCVSG